MVCRAVDCDAHDRRAELCADNSDAFARAVAFAFKCADCDAIDRRAVDCDAVHSNTIDCDAVHCDAIDRRAVDCDTIDRRAELSADNSAELVAIACTELCANDSDAFARAVAFASKCADCDRPAHACKHVDSHGLADRCTDHVG